MHFNSTTKPSKHTNEVPMDIITEPVGLRDKRNLGVHSQFPNFNTLLLSTVVYMMTESVLINNLRHGFNIFRSFFADISPCTVAYLQNISYKCSNYV